MGTIEILKTGITNLRTDALVNAANEGLWEGGGVCGVIFRAAGSKQLQAACNEIGGCKTGSAVITPGFNLKSKYIIHAVGPRWQDGNHDEPKLLYSAYKQSLLLAKENHCKSIGFPLISAGIFGYPVDKAWRKALQACLDFQRDNPDSDLDIQFAVIEDNVLDTGKKTLSELRTERTPLYLKQLDSGSLQNIRNKISQEPELLIDKKVHPMAGGLAEILFDSRIINILTTEQLIKMIESIFPDWVTEEGWISRYGDLLLRIIDAEKKEKANERAEKYEKHLRTILIPALKAGSRSGSVMDDIEQLIDVYKVSVCLYRFYALNEKEFIFSADRESMEKLNQSILQIKGMGMQVFGFDLASVKPEEKQYALFLSWILEEMLLSQEEFKVEV